jgi:methylaspartate mutase epsilon subunit
MPARDIDGCLRILEPGAMPIPRDVMEVHEAQLRRRAEAEGIAYGADLAVSSVFELSEQLDRLMPSS